jgi:hypothetical protein
LNPVSSDLAPKSQGTVKIACVGRIEESIESKSTESETVAAAFEIYIFWRRQSAVPI